MCTIATLRFSETSLTESALYNLHFFSYTSKTFLQVVTLREDVVHDVKECPLHIVQAIADHTCDVASSKPRTLHLHSSTSAPEHKHEVELLRLGGFPVSHRSSEYRCFTPGCFLRFSSRVSIDGTQVRHEVESEVSEPAGLSIGARWFPDALQVDCASFVLSCVQLRRTCLWLRSTSATRCCSKTAPETTTKS